MCEDRERALVSDQCTSHPTRGREANTVLHIKDLSDVSTLYHASGCQCSEACRALTLQEKAMDLDKDKGLKILTRAEAGRELDSLTVL